MKLTILGASGRVSSCDVADLVLRVAEEPRFRQVRVGLSY